MKKLKDTFKRMIVIFLILIQVIAEVPIAVLANIDYSSDNTDIYSKLKIGAFVNYVPKAITGSDGKYIIQAKYSGTDEDQEFMPEDLKTWRILNINKDNGTMDLIAGNVTSEVTLKGAQGYNNGVYLLNEMCRNLYSNEDLGAVARCVNELDILEHLQSSTVYLNYTEYDENNNLKYKFNTIKSLEKKGTYPVQWLNDDSDTNTSYIKTLSENRELIEPDASVGGSYNDPISVRGSYYKIDNFNSEFKNLSEDEVVRINGTATNIYRDILFFGDDFSSDRYWLATRFIDPVSSEGQVLFGLSMSAANLYRPSMGGSSNWWSAERTYGVKPIVTVPISQINTDAVERDGTKDRPFKLGNDDTKTTITFKNENLYNEVVKQIYGIVEFETEPNYLSITINKSDINKIKKLDLANKEILDITGLGRFIGLTELDISNNAISDISGLSTLTNLKTLIAFGNIVKDISSISNLTSLTVLNLAKNKIYDSDDVIQMSKLSGLTNLVELDLSHNYIKYTNGLNNLVNLKKLNLFDNAICDFSGLDGLTNLEILSLGENNDKGKFTIANMEALSTLENLKELDFSTNYTPTILNYIENLTNLEKLDLSRNNLNDNYAGNKIASLKNLKDLNLYGNYIWTITPLLELTELEELNIHGNLYPALTGILTDYGLVWKNIKKLNISSITKLDPNCNEVKYLVNKASNGEIELDYEYLTDTSNLPHIDSNGISYVTYDDFGARCDGEFDDFIAIRNAHQYANKYGYEVRATTGKIYHIYKYYELALPVNTNVDWCNATFIIHDENIEEKLGRFQTIFKVTNIDSNDIITIENPTWTVGKSTKKLTNIDNELQSLNSKGYSRYQCVIVNNDKRQFIRYGSNANNGYTQRDSFIIDSEGNILNDIIWDFENISTVKLIPIPDTQSYIRNGTFITNSLESQSETNYSRPGDKPIYFQRNIEFLNCENIDISGIRHTLSEDVISGSYYGFIYMETCADITLENSCLFARKFLQSGRSTYDITMHESVNVTCKDLTSNNILDANRWGITGTKFTKDVVYDNCSINRVDAHEGIYNLTVKNSDIGSKGVGIVGFGTVNIINTILESQAAFSLRGDYGTFFDGNVNIIDCTFRHNSVWAWSLFYGDPEGIGVGHDFGYECMYPNIYIENITFDCQYKPDATTFLMFPLWNKEVTNNVPTKYWNSNIYINGYKFINTNTTDPKLKFCNENYANMQGNYVITNTKFIDSEGNDLTHKFNFGEKVSTDKDIILTVNENATAINKVTIYKNNVAIVENETVENEYNYTFNETGKYKIIMSSIENAYNKTGEKEYEFEITKPITVNDNGSKGKYISKDKFGFLRVSESKENAFILKGVSTLNFLTSKMQWFSDTSIKTLKSWGGNVVRICFVPSYWRDEKEGIMQYNSTTDRYDLLEDKYNEKLNSLFEAIDVLIDNEMYAIVNWHTLYTGYYNNHFLYTHQDIAKKFFTDVANRYKNNPYVIYEINNEDPEEWSSIANYAEYIIPAIREISPDSLIIVGTPRMDGSPNKVETNVNNERYLNYPNLVYAFHVYPGGNANWKTTSFEEALKMNLPIIVTEWSTCKGGDTYDEVFANNLMKVLKENKIGWCNFAWGEVDVNGNEYAITKAKQWNEALPDEVLCNNGKYLKNILGNYDKEIVIDLTNEENLKVYNKMIARSWGNLIWSSDVINKITSIQFDTSINIPEGVQTFNLGATYSTNVIGYIVENSYSTDDSKYYDLHIQADGKIYANESCSNLFRAFSNVNNIDLTNFVVTPNTTDTNSMFYGLGSTQNTNSEIVTNLTVKLGDEFDTSNVTNMTSMFQDLGSRSKKVQVDLGSKFSTSNVEDMTFTFKNMGGYDNDFYIDVSNLTFNDDTNYTDIFGRWSNKTRTIYVKDEEMKQFILSKLPENTENVKVIIKGDINLDDTITAFDLVKEMKVGYNLGNSLDVLNKDKGFYFDIETYWGNPKVTKEQIDTIKNMGFNSIRIPVSYYNHLDENGVIDPNWLERVKTVVDYAKSNDMYVIINVHHDTSMDKNLNWIFADTTTYEEDLSNITNLWAQIAEYFKDYDNKLLFEFSNEIMSRDWTWDYWNRQDDLRVMHNMNQELINLVRATGGNNAKRFLVIAPYAGVVDKMPIDLLIGDGFSDVIKDHLIIDVHCYRKTIEEITRDFDRINEYIEKYNIPFIMGEFGTKTDVENSLRVELADKYAYYSNMYNVPVFWWDNGSNTGFALFDRKTLEILHQDIIDALLKYFKINPEHTHNLVKIDAVDATYEKNGNIEYYKCSECGKLFSDSAGKNEITENDVIILRKIPVLYEILDGANQVYSGKGKLTVRASGDINKFVMLKVDGNEVKKEYYSLKSGSTIISLNELYLATLDEGIHKLTFVYTDGEVSTNFTIKKQKDNENNNQDDNNNENNKDNNNQQNNQNNNEQNSSNNNNNENQNNEPNSNNQSVNNNSNNTNHIIVDITDNQQDNKTQNNTSTNNNSTKSNPKTGDYIYIWIGVITISIVGIVVIIIYKNKDKQK